MKIIFGGALNEKECDKMYLKVFYCILLCFPMFSKISQLLNLKCFTNMSFELRFFIAQVCTLERLKQRFGESCLHFCEVILKDVADSKRINNTIFTQMPNVDEVRLYVHMCVISHAYLINT